MADLLDYVLWRGDISFEAAALNEIDCLIFVQLSYIKFDDIVPVLESKDTVSLAEAADRFFTAPDFAERSDNGPLISKKTVELLRSVSTAARFKNIPLCAYVNIIDSTAEKQFAAVSFVLPNKTLFCAFRGTDDTLIGWKEDFNMAFLPEIPAQHEAVRYVQTAAALRPFKTILLGGHSKGGNLAVYAAAKCSQKLKSRITGVYNFDGPGFTQETLDTKDFCLDIPAVHTFIPEMSVVGMLFEQVGTVSIVESTERGLMQHDTFSWVLSGPRFCLIQGISLSSHMIDRTVKNLLAKLDIPQRRILVNTIAEIIQASKAQRLSDFHTNIIENSIAMLGAMRKVDADTREIIIHIIQLLFTSAKDAVRQIYGEKHQIQT